MLKAEPTLIQIILVMSWPCLAIGADPSTKDGKGFEKLGHTARGKTKSVALHSICGRYDDGSLAERRGLDKKRTTCDAEGIVPLDLSDQLIRDTTRTDKRRKAVAML